MSSAQQVANSFVVEFFERLAKNPADLTELYGHHASLHINDFELGITEAFDNDVPVAVQKWASIVQGSKLRVESVNAAPIYGGVNVFVTLSAIGLLQQYFQITTTLESYTAFNSDGYFVRAQVISRIGALEAPAAPEPVAEPAAVAPPAAAAAAPVAEAAPTPKAEETPKKKAAKKPPTPAAADEVAAAAPAVEERAATPKAEAAPAKPAAPKSWASLAGAAPTKPAAAAHPIRVIAHEGPAVKREEAPAKDAKAPAAYPKRERRVERPVGERLMFNVTATVTDDEVKAALGALAESLVSLRNASDRGHVFLDFAEGIAAYEDLRRLSPSVGSNSQKMSVYHQRPRESRQ